MIWRPRLCNKGENEMCGAFGPTNFSHFDFAMTARRHAHCTWGWTTTSIRFGAKNVTETYKFARPWPQNYDFPAIPAYFPHVLIGPKLGAEKVYTSTARRPQSLRPPGGGGVHFPGL